MNGYNNNHSFFKEDYMTPKELLEYMDKNFSYGYLDKNNNIHNYSDKDFNDNWYELYILEDYDDVLRTKIGNCYDMVEFEREWFERNNYEVETYYEIVSLPYENIYPSHAFLVYKHNDNYYHFEYSDFNNRGIHGYDNVNDLLESQYKSYIDLLEEKSITEEEKTHIVLTKFTKPDRHIGAKEYINHALNGEKVYIDRHHNIVK
jgi:hypothetical protein